MNILVVMLSKLPKLHENNAGVQITIVPEECI